MRRLQIIGFLVLLALGCATLTGQSQERVRFTGFATFTQGRTPLLNGNDEFFPVNFKPVASGDSCGSAKILTVNGDVVTLQGQPGAFTIAYLSSAQVAQIRASRDRRARPGQEAHVD